MRTEDIKKYYNRALKDIGDSGYESRRWFRNKISKSGYDMTLESIMRHYEPSKQTFSDYLELGPGPGTWTKLFLKCNDHADYDLVDISKEMLAQARESLGENKTIRFFETDFLEYQPDKKYDVFFSSRVIEYFPDKEVLVEKIVKTLKSGATGFIITKTPKYKLNKFLKRKTADFHSGQIPSGELSSMFQKNGCKNIKMYPVVMSFPIFRSVTLNKILFKIFSRSRLNIISNFFSESYCIKFTKK